MISKLPFTILNNLYFNQKYSADIIINIIDDAKLFNCIHNNP